MSWVLASQDYTHHKFGDPRPPIQRTYFASAPAAQAAFRRFRTEHPNCDNHPASVTQVWQQRQLSQNQTDFGFELATGPRRLTG